MQVRQPLRALRNKVPRRVGAKGQVALLARINVFPKVATLAELHDDAQLVLFDKGSIISADAWMIELRKQFYFIQCRLLFSPGHVDNRNSLETHLEAIAVAREMNCTVRSGTQHLANLEIGAAHGGPRHG